MKMKISKVKNKTSTKNRKDLGEVGVQAKYIFTRIAKVKSLHHQSPNFNHIKTDKLLH
jgi:hypothetical protein